MWVETYTSSVFKICFCKTVKKYMFPFNFYIMSSEKLIFVFRNKKKKSFCKTYSKFLKILEIINNIHWIWNATAKPIKLWTATNP